MKETESKQVRGARPSVDSADPVKWYTSNETAAMLGYKYKTLTNLRCAGTGPIYHKLGNRVWYRGNDLKTWCNARRYRGTGLKDDA